MLQTQAVERQTVTPKQAAAMLSVHVETIRRMTRRGDLPSVKIGTTTRIPVRALEQLLNGEQPRDEAVSDGT